MSHFEHNVPNVPTLVSVLLLPDKEGLTLSGQSYIMHGGIWCLIKKYILAQAFIVKCPCPWFVVIKKIFWHQTTSPRGPLTGMKWSTPHVNLV